MLINVIEYQKTIFDYSFKTMEIFIGQAEQMIHDCSLIDSPLNTTLVEFKNECKKYKNKMDEEFEKLVALY
jgi:hypothetical protein